MGDSVPFHNKSSILLLQDICGWFESDITRKHSKQVYVIFYTARSSSIIYQNKLDIGTGLVILWRFRSLRFDRIPIS